MAVNWPSQATITSPTIVTGCRNFNKPLITVPMPQCKFSTGTHSSLASATLSPLSSPALSSLQFSATSPTEDLSAKLSRYDADEDNGDDADDANDDEIIPAIHRTGVCSLSRGHPDHGPAATLVRLILSRRSMSTINLLCQVVLVLLHADQPGPLLHLRRSPDFRRLHPRREARVDKVRVFFSILNDDSIWREFNMEI